MKELSEYKSHENYIMSQDILFNKRKLKSLLKQGYNYITFDRTICVWNNEPYFVKSDNFKLTDKEKVEHGLWINSNYGTKCEALGLINVNDPKIHLYSIQKLLEVIPNCEQI